MSEFVTADEVGDPKAGMRITTTRVNGELMQEGNTADMIFIAAAPRPRR